MRSPDDDPLQPVTGCCTLLQLLLWCEHLDRAFLARPKQDQFTSDTASRVDEFNRRARNCFNFRAPTPSRSAPGIIPYEILLRRMFSYSNLKRTQYTKNGLSNLVTASTLSPPMSEMGVRREKAARSSGCKSHPATAPAGSNRSSHGGDEMAEVFG